MFLFASPYFPSRVLIHGRNLGPVCAKFPRAPRWGARCGRCGCRRIALHVVGTCGCGRRICLAPHPPIVLTNETARKESRERNGHGQCCPGCLPFQYLSHRRNLDRVVEYALSKVVSCSLGNLNASAVNLCGRCIVPQLDAAKGTGSQRTALRRVQDNCGVRDFGGGHVSTEQGRPRGADSTEQGRRRPSTKCYGCLVQRRLHGTDGMSPGILPQ